MGCYLRVPISLGIPGRLASFMILMTLFRGKKPSKSKLFLITKKCNLEILGLLKYFWTGDFFLNQFYSFLIILFIVFQFWILNLFQFVEPLILQQMSDDELANQLRETFDKHYGRGWNCLVGRDFGAFVQHEPKTMAFFYVDRTAIMIFKAK